MELGRDVMAVHRVIGVELLLVLESLFCYV